MLINLLSTLVTLIYSATSSAVYPYELISALRPTSTAKSAALSLEIATKSSSAGNFTVTSACWKIYSSLEGNKFTSIREWDLLIKATKTEDEAEFLSAVFEKFGNTIPLSPREQIKRRLEAAKKLAAMQKVKLGAKTETVKVVATKDGFEIKTGKPVSAVSEADAGQPIDRESLDVNEDWLDAFCNAATTIPLNKVVFMDFLEALKELPPEKQLGVIDWVRQEYGNKMADEASGILTAARAEAHTAVSGEPATDLVAGRARLAIYQLTKDAVNADQPTFRKAIDLTKAVKPPDRQLFEDIKAALEKNMKIADKSSLMNELIEELEELTQEPGAKAESQPVAEAEITLPQELSAADSSKIEPVAPEATGAGLALEKEVPAKAGPEEKIEPAPAAKAGRDEIELDLDESGVSKPPVEKPEDVLSRAAREIGAARTERMVDTLASKYLEGTLIKGDDKYKEKVNAMADKRKDEIKKLRTVTQRLNNAMNSAVATYSDDKNAEDWLKETNRIFTDAVDVEKILDGLDIELELENNSHYSQAVRLIAKKKGLFTTWSRIVTSAESASKTAATFHELDLIAKELKEKFGKFPECMTVPEAFIESGRRRLISKQNAAIKRINDLVEELKLCEEYKILDKLLTEFKESFQKLEKRAKDKGFESLADAAKRAVVEIKFFRGRKYLIRYRGSGWFKYRPLKKPLQEVVDKRAALIEQLKRYMNARKAVLDSLKPIDLALTEEDRKEGGLDAVINSVVLDKMKGIEQDAPGITDRYQDKFKVRDIAGLISNADKKYVKPIWDKIQFLKKKKFKVLTAEALKTEKAVSQEKLITEQDTALAAPALVIESKVSAAIGAQA